MKSKNSFFYFLIAYLLTGCGDETLSNYTTGVSLSGTGLPSNTGNGDDMRPRPSEGEDNIDENYKEYIIWSEGEKTYSCNNLEVSIQLSHNISGELINVGNGIIVELTDQNRPTNVSLEVNVKNIGENSIYTYLENCKLPFELINESQKELKSNLIAQCKSGEAIQIYAPFESKKFQYKFALPLENQKWLFKYVPSYSINQFAPVELRNSCDTYYQLDIIS